MAAAKSRKDEPNQCCMQCNINLIEAAAKIGVKKYILLTSIGVGNSQEAPPAQVYDVLKPVLIEKGKAEDKLKVSCCVKTRGSDSYAPSSSVRDSKRYHWHRFTRH